MCWEDEYSVLSVIEYLRIDINLRANRFNFNPKTEMFVEFYIIIIVCVIVAAVIVGETVHRACTGRLFRRSIRNPSMCQGIHDILYKPTGIWICAIWMKRAKDTVIH